MGGLLALRIQIIFFWMNNNEESLSLRNTPPRYLSVSEAAEVACISVRKMREIIASRELRHARIGRWIMIRLEDLEKWINRNLKPAWHD